MRCSNCGTETTSNFCPNCGHPLNPNVSQNHNMTNPNNIQQYNTIQNVNAQKYNNVPPVRKNHSGLDIAAFVISFLGCLGLVGIILGIVDLTTDKSNKHKHGLSIAAIVIGSLMSFIVLFSNIGKISNRDSKNNDSQPSTSSAISDDVNELSENKEAIQSGNIEEKTEQEIVEYDLSLEDIIAEYDAQGYDSVSLDADVLYNYGAYYTGWVAHTAFIVKEVNNDSVCCETGSNDTYFFSLVCNFADDEDIVINEGDAIELIGVVAEPSSVGSTVTLNQCKIVSNGDKAKEVIETLKSEADQQIEDAEAVKVVSEQAAQEEIIKDKEEFKDSCESVNYSDVERNPDNYNGKNIMVSGKVIQVSEGWLDSVTIRVEASGGNVWYVTYYREEGESRILNNDQVTVYGECTGVTTYISALGTSVTIPSMKAKIVDIK